MKTLFFSFFLAYCLLLTGLSYGQSAKFRHLTIDDGLSQNSVQDFIQDPLGFIWIATQDGLNRYDGYNFRIYKNDLKDSNSISTNYLRCLYVASDSNIWIGTRNRVLECFDHRSGRFIHHPLPAQKDKNTGRIGITSIVEDANNKLYISTSGEGIYIFDRKKSTWENLHYDDHDPNSLPIDNIQNIAFDKQGILWCATWGAGVAALDTKTKKFKRYTNLNTLKIRSLYPDRNGKIWVSTWVGGINVIDPTTDDIDSGKDTTGLGKYLNYGLIWGFMEDRKGQIWLATAEDGVICHNPKTKKTIQYKHNPQDPNSLSDNLVWTLFEDKSGLIWGGTWQSGINIFDPQKQKMEHYYYNANETGSLIANTVWSISQGKENKTWYGTSSGVCSFDPKTHAFTRLEYNKDPNAPAENTIIQAVQEDNDGQIWIGSNGAGLFRYDPKTKKFKHYLVDMTNGIGITSESVQSILLDKSNRLWIVGGGGGINLYDRETDRFSYYIKRDGDENFLSSNTISTILEGKDGKLWVATADAGVDLLDPVTRKVKNFRHESNNPKSLPDNNAISLYIDQNELLWVGTAGGLCCYLEAKNEFIVFTEKDGLPNNLINGIQSDTEGNLWLSTNKGICLLNPTTRKVRSYDVNDGVQSNEFNQNASCKTKDGYIYFGGVKGLNRFDPRMLTNNPYAPNIVLTAFSVLNKPYVLAQELHISKEILLDYKDYFFSFEFAGLEFTNSAKNRYQYMLEGFNDEWIDIGTTRFITFTNLDPGDYTLYLKASNSDGVWSPSNAGLHIHITPPFWKTKWFYAICLVTIILSIYSYIKYRERQLKIEKVFLENKVEERTAELKEEKLKVEEKQKEILDSIHYAKRIQRSLLTTEKYIEKSLKRLKK